MARLVRPVERPGVIRLGLVRRILAGVAAMTDRLPLLRRFGGRREFVANTPIVHARWMGTAPVEAPPAAAVAPAIVRGAPIDTLERVVARASDPAASRGASTAERAPESAVSAPRPIQRPEGAESPRAAASAWAAVLPSRTVEPAAGVEPLRSAGGSATAVAPNPTVEPAAASGSLAAREPGARAVELERGSVRRSRVGAPLPARPPIAQRPIAHDAPALRASAVPVDAAAARTVRATPDPGSAAGTSAMPRVKPRAAAVEPRARAPAIPVIARRAVQPPIAEPRVHPKPVIAPAAAHRRPSAEHRPQPLVQPSGSTEAERARATALTLAHPPMAAPAGAVAQRPVELAPVPIAAHRAVAEPAPVPIAARRAVAEPAPLPAPRIDLHQLAEHVQRILLRQSAHARARQGLPR